MRTLSSALLLVAAAGLTACSDFTRPNEILIIAEPPAPAANAPAPGKAAPAAPAAADEAAARKAPPARPSQPVKQDPGACGG